MLVNGIEMYELARENISPVFRFGKDGCTARRQFTVPWEKFHQAVVALRGNTELSSDNLRYVRTSPYQFWWQEMSRQFTCVDVTEGKGAGIARNMDGSINTETGKARSSAELLDQDDVGVADSVHLIADFEVVPYAIFEDVDVDDPINPEDLDQLPYEWDRYTEWDADFSSSLISVPQGAYRYYSNKQQVNIPIRIPVAEAKITATIYGLPSIPTSALMFNGAVNDRDFTFYLQPRDGFANVFFIAPPESLLFLYAKSVKRMTGYGERLYDVTLHFSYRQYGHNTTPYFNPSTKRVTFERYAADVSTLVKAKTDNSACFRLRNFGYFWTPAKPPVA